MSNIRYKQCIGIEQIITIIMMGTLLLQLLYVPLVFETVAGLICDERLQHLHLCVVGQAIPRPVRFRKGRDSHITGEHTRLCGEIHPEWFDESSHSCDDGVVVAKPTSTQPTTTAITPPVISCRRNSILNCSGNLQCGGHDGYECCGYERYHPGFQTCCQISSAKHTIHDDKSAKQHVCCGLSVYRRGSSDVSCEHASSNDKLFGKLPKWRHLNDVLCLANEFELHYVYKVAIVNQSTSGSTRYLDATISMWTLELGTSGSKINMRSPPAIQDNMMIPLDRYSRTKKNLIGKCFFMVTKKNYLDNAIFFLSPMDTLYKWPRSRKKQRRITKLLRKIQRKCRRRKDIRNKEWISI